MNVKLKWVNTWPGDWNLYDGAVNVATVERDKIAGYRVLVRCDQSAKWQRARDVDDAKKQAYDAVVAYFRES